MRLHRGVATLAVVSALAGTATPAYAFQPIAPASGTPPATRVQQPSDGGPGDEVLIAVAVAGGVTVLGAGAIATRRHSRRHRAPAVTGS